jgi:hypothetical protein
VAIGQKTEISIVSDDGELLANTVAASTVLKVIELSHIIVPIFVLVLLYVYIMTKEDKSGS